MPVKVKIAEPQGTYFITFTCSNWLPLIQLTNAYDAVYKWFDTLVKNGHSILGYVIMPNHVHVLISFKNNGQSINTIVGNGKRFMAYEIVKRLKAQGETKVLANMELAVSEKDKQRNKRHEVWKNSFDWKECNINEYIEQKLNYIHLNPCQGKWNLSNTPEDYEHSSAKFYICDIQGVFPVTNYLELADIDFSGDNI
jgi:REP element-mobilizing transposase RayT